jgi:hypothetical protein
VEIDAQEILTEQVVQLRLQRLDLRLYDLGTGRPGVSFHAGKPLLSGNDQEHAFLAKQRKLFLMQTVQRVMDTRLCLVA